MKYCILFWAFAAGLCACANEGDQRLSCRLGVPYETVPVDGHEPVNMGGFGSSMCFHAADSSFYLLTDRGPNVEGAADGSLVFPLPDYAPLIGQFRRQGDSLVLLRKIVLRQADGTPFNGLPNAGTAATGTIGSAAEMDMKCVTETAGSTGETPYDLYGNLIADPGRCGLDPEGLAVAPDGTFWVSDEYGPLILHFDREGLLMEKFAPGAGLPEHYALRRPNRGMEGLTISPDGANLYGIMQSPLYYPDAATKDRSVNNRIVEINLTEGSVREYLYRLDEPWNVVSEICFVGGSSLLVLERDGEFPRGGAGFKKVFRVELSPRAEIAASEAIEPLSPQGLSDRGIEPVEKTLFVDILKEIPGYRHDKPEGIALLGDSVLCVVNDDDFGIAPQPSGLYGPKRDSYGQRDACVIYFIRP